MNHQTIIKAILGPTNTGKTHYAVERMLAHNSGIIGFPLRLLARENYDKIVKAKGVDQVALITGEEKIIPQRPRYYVCTVESMPTNVQTDFVCIDEVQLAADAERGHVFTDRILYARGRFETLFLGADTMRQMMHTLVSGIEIETRPRLSKLTYAGPSKLSKLAPRSAVVAFSVQDVYAIAEQLKRHKGGAGIVLGALSPRARNAQVDLFQSGEVDYLVATDAIGMGLNMNVHHVALAAVRKFDGKQTRFLSVAELAQIVGRAGRYKDDGTFGTTEQVGPLPDKVVEALETHQFDMVNSVYWRSANLDFSSLNQLLRSLSQPPDESVFMLKRDAEDQRHLEALAKHPDVVNQVNSPDQVKLLWAIAQVPDFGKNLDDTHLELLAQLYQHLGKSGQLPDAFVEEKITQLDSTKGDIDTLMVRMAIVRTWTYLSHVVGWMANAAEWQARARLIEDRLSDALHFALMARFVDRRSSLLLKKEDYTTDFAVKVEDNDDVRLDGETVGTMKALRFNPASHIETDQMLVKRIETNLVPVIAERVKLIDQNDGQGFYIRGDGKIYWRGEAIAELVMGDSVLQPRIRILDYALLDPGQIAILERVAKQWLEKYLEKTLRLLMQQTYENDPSATVRGITYQLQEYLGCVPKAKLDSMLRNLNQQDIDRLRKMGVKIGKRFVYMPPLMNNHARTLRAMLLEISKAKISTVKDDWATFKPQEPSQTAEDANKMGYAALQAEPRMVRVETLESVASSAHTLGGQGAFVATNSLLSFVGGNLNDLVSIMRELGYKVVKDDDFGGTPTFYREEYQLEKMQGKRKNRSKNSKMGPNSPFAVLQKLKNDNR